MNQVEVGLGGELESQPPKLLTRLEHLIGSGGLVVLDVVAVVSDRGSRGRGGESEAAEPVSGLHYGQGRRCCGRIRSFSPYTRHWLRCSIAAALAGARRV